MEHKSGSLLSAVAQVLTGSDERPSKTLEIDDPHEVLVWYREAQSQGISLDNGFLGFVGNTPRNRGVLLRSLMWDHEVEGFDVKLCWNVIEQTHGIDARVVDEWIVYFQELFDRNLDWGSQNYDEFFLENEGGMMRITHPSGYQCSCSQEALLDELKKLMQRYNHAVAST